MKIEIPSVKTLNLPVSDLSQQPEDQALANGSNKFVEALQSSEAPVISYNPEQLHAQGNTISSQIVESIAELNTSLKDAYKDIANPAHLPNHQEFEKMTSNSVQKTRSNGEGFLSDSMKVALDRMDRTNSNSAKFRKTLLAFRLVDSYLSAFKNTVNKFLRM